jgi:hypothetical protein
MEAEEEGEEVTTPDLRDLVLSQQQMIAELERENAKLREAMRIMQDELYKARAMHEEDHNDHS